MQTPRICEVRLCTNPAILQSTFILRNIIRLKANLCLYHHTTLKNLYEQGIQWDNEHYG